MLTFLTYHLSTLVLLVILFIASCTDFTRHRIPNLLTLGGTLLGLALQAWALGVGGLLDGLGGLAVGLFTLLPFYITRAMGAGDVKLMAMVGSFLGIQDALVAVAASLIAGGAIALGIIVARGGILALLRRYTLSLRCLLATGQWIYIPPVPDEVAAARFPYAIAIATGTTAALWWLEMLNPLTAWLQWP